MKKQGEKIICVVLILSILFTMFGCNKKETAERNLPGISEAYLMEVGDSVIISDFRELYLLMTNLSNGKEMFLEQLTEAQKICQKHGLSLIHGSWFLTDANEHFITEDSIKKYKEDIYNEILYSFAMEMLYLAVFDKYGYDALQVKNISIDEVLNLIEEEGFTTVKESKNDYTGTIESRVNPHWELIGAYEISYHSNGLIESIEIPVIENNNRPANDEFEYFFDATEDEKKYISSIHYEGMLNSFDKFTVGRNVLSLIYSESELTVLENYIKSLTIDEIWEYNLLSYYASEPNYMGAIVPLRYKDTSIAISFDLNNISLRIIGINYVNEFTSHYYPILVELFGEHIDGYNREDFESYILNDVESNKIIPEYEINLDDLESEYIASAFAEQSTIIEKLQVNYGETIAFNGTILYNDGAFPTYCLKLDDEVLILLSDDITTEEFSCLYLYFYDDSDINGGYNYEELINKKCTVTATLENYRGGGDLYIVSPVIDIV